MRVLVAGLFLAALSVFALPAAAATTPVWAGTWQTNWGPLTITGSGGGYVASFGYADSWNEPLGHITSATASGTGLSGTWSHDPPSHFAPRDHGTFQVTWSYANGKAAFEGKATYEADGTSADFFGSCKSGQCAADRTPPSVKALAASGKRGTTVSLRWHVSDDRGTTTDVLKVYRGSKQLWSFRTTHHVAAGKTYSAKYRAPRTAGALKLVVTATDKAGNSRSSSARVLIR